MRSIDRVLGLAVVGGCAVFLACTRSTPEPPALPQSAAAARSVFTDTALYRRHCVVPDGKPIDLKQPCLLLDQGRPPDRRPPGVRR